jgi:hypothetical protein
MMPWPIIDRTTLTGSTNMIKTTLLISLLWSFSLISSDSGKGQALYDFDHKISYRLTQLNETHYRLSVREGNYEAFATQAVFLLRKSKEICGSERFNLALGSGVQSFEKFPSEPRANPGPLKATLKCDN